MLYIDVLDAYRADLASAKADSFTDADATWLAFASLLQRALALPRRDREEYLHVAIAGLDVPFGEGPPINGTPPSDDTQTTLFGLVIRIADDAEQAGAFALATTILDAGQALLDAGRDKWHGRMLWQQARILRKLGDVDRAQEHLVKLKDAASELDDADLVALSWIGLAAVARVRGNFPDARQAFASALALAAQTDPELGVRRHAQHGLLVSAAAAGDFDAALRYGIAALDGSPSVEQRAEILTNLAAVCLDAGESLAALHAFLQVLTSACPKRVRMSALGGAAVAAAKLGKTRIVERLATMAEDITTRERGFAHEIADMSRELYESFALLGNEERAMHYRRDASRRAETHGFHEITHRIDTFSVPREAAPREAAPREAAPRHVELSAEVLGVTQSLELGDADTMLASASTMGWD
jgi:tetratricopeptide (TPR) repeat protein